MKYTFKFKELNRRLDLVRTRTKTLELDPELLKHYDVDAMTQAFLSAAHRFTFEDSTVFLTGIKVGRVEFKLV